MISQQLKIPGIRRQFLLSLFAGFVVIVFLFLLLLERYSKPVVVAKQQEISVDDSVSAQMIEKLDATPAKPVETKSSEILIQKTSQTVTVDNAFSLASQSPISAYRNEQVLKVSAEQKSISTSPTIVSAQSPYTVSAGTILPATLVTGIQSDLPTQIVAKTRRDVFDTVSGNYLVIPQGATLIGRYDSQISFGQQQLMVCWERIIFPNGTSMNLHSEPGVDLSGQSGLKDGVDNHTGKILGTTLMMSLFGAAGQLAMPASRHASTLQEEVFSQAGQQINQTASQYLSKAMNVQPTITISPGMNFNVMLTQDIIFPGPYAFA